MIKITISYLICVCLSACAFNGKNVEINAGDKFALAVFSSNYHVTYHDPSSRDEEDNAIGTYKTLGKTLGGESPLEITRSDERLSPHPVSHLVARALPVVENGFASSKFKLISIDKVIKNKTYISSARNDSSDENNIYYSEGFGRINFGNSDLMRSLCNELGVSGFIVIDIQFLKEEKSEGLKYPRPISAAVIVSCSVYSKNSKLLWKTVQTAKSEIKIEKKYDGYDHEALDKELGKCFETAAASLFSKISVLQ